MLYTKRKQYRGRWFVKLTQLILALGIIFFGLDALGHYFTQSAIDRVIVVEIEGAALNLDNQATMNINPALDYRDYFYLALDHQRAGDYYDATVDYSNSIELNPEIAASWLNRGVAYEQLGRDTHAMFDFNQWMTRDGIYVIEQDLITESTDFIEEMHPNYRFDIPMDVYSGQVVDITVATIDTVSVDPIIVLVNEDGEPVAANDDIRNQDGSLISMMSLINNYEVAESGEYTLMVTHAGGGSEGEFVIRISIEN